MSESTRTACWISFLSGPFAPAAAASSSTTPSLSSPERSCWPPSSLRRSSSRQVAKRSVQASIVHSQRPVRSTTNEPPQRTPLWWASSWCSSASAHLRSPARRCRTTARSFSWPSRNTSAETSTRSPTVRLAGIPPRIHDRLGVLDVDPRAATRCGSLSASWAGVSVRNVAETSTARRRASRTHAGGGETFLGPGPKRTVSYSARPWISLAPPACSSIRPRCPPAASDGTPTPGSTGSPTRGSRGGRCCRSARPIATARPTRRARRSPPGRACSPSPRRPSRRPRRSTSASARRAGSRTGRASRGAARWPTRCASSASGRRCAPTRTSAAWR